MEPVLIAGWLALAPTDTAFSRITLDFDLRGANLHFSELVVPGIGGVSCVRQLTWAVAGIRLRNELMAMARPPRATQLSNAIEALGCKAEYLHNLREDDDISPRVLGRRAFARDGELVCSFQDLSAREHYVQNTYRATATRALRADVGLDLARGSRFDTLVLEPVGEAAAQALLEQGGIGRGSVTLKSWLQAWVAGEKAPATPNSSSWTSLRPALSPETPSREERRLIRARLLDVDGPAADKRRTLAPLLEGDAVLDDVEVVIEGVERTGKLAFARQIALARAFGSLLDSCIHAVEVLSGAIERAGRLSVNAAAREVKGELSALRESARLYLAGEETSPQSGHREAHALARMAAAGRSVSADDEALVRELIRREGRVIALIDGFVHKGPLFRNLTARSDDDEAVDVDDRLSMHGRTFRLANFHELLRDTLGRR